MMPYLGRANVTNWPVYKQDVGWGWSAEAGPSPPPAAAETINQHKKKRPKITAGWDEHQTNVNMRVSLLLTLCVATCFQVSLHMLLSVLNPFPSSRKFSNSEVSGRCCFFFFIYSSVRYKSRRRLEQRLANVFFFSKILQTLLFCFPFFFDNLSPYPEQLYR